MVPTTLYPSHHKPHSQGHRTVTSTGHSRSTAHWARSITRSRKHVEPPLVGFRAFASQDTCRLAPFCHVHYTELIRINILLTAKKPQTLLTGYGSTELERDALQQGAYAVLQKPVDPDVIYSAVTRSILRAEILRRSLPSDLTPPEIHQRELLSEREQLSARIQAITARLEDTLASEQPS